MGHRFAGEELKVSDSALYDQYKAATPSKFLNIESTSAFGLDGKKLGEAKDAKENMTPEQRWSSKPTNGATAAR